MIGVERIVVGQLQTNSYLIFNDNEAILIDPGGEPGKILSVIARYGFNLKFIVNTHGHIDHIAGNDKIAGKTGAKVLIHSEDAPMLSDPKLNLSFEKEGDMKKPDRMLMDGDIIETDKIKLKVISTPGHTRGSISLLLEDKIFCGDTIFAQGVGRTDFPGGDSKMLIQSIKKLLQFPENIRLYPGHGPETTIGEVTGGLKWFLN
ncbi:MAG: MBL fold metallo-hydrolase [bacterium]|nr:MBL fold metallo-hydrolase [bacterium]